MSATISLLDPQTGALVHLRRAELNQTCRACGLKMLGEWIASVEGSQWMCIAHLERTLMAEPVSQEFRARAEARRQLEDCAPGDEVTVTRQMLVAVGLAR